MTRLRKEQDADEELTLISENSTRLKIVDHIINYQNRDQRYCIYVPVP